jgi:hypothetical protein
MQQSRPNLPKLLVASCCTLVAELALIRWLSTEVRIFAYAKNLALLLCFLGFGVGCALASQRVWWRRGVLAQCGSGREHAGGGGGWFDGESIAGRRP